ncbi:helix-turn-helix domain-containing protein [Catenuloplanes atrovinosus]|uniref:Transcriptional regulator with XRE-family HTH domain n=1 Tax=Catenuloplanes atrovinosus TaxID=137266 RepID=A0AAE3YNL0_9ACTN|nr:helix-turn-helix domain-containing protein [Catenuloplanes atrovinosus]MDR7277118.1 transcriptional regulator with XRE-family HTH domain [Catenuloplanes atrovinosus]
MIPGNDLGAALRRWRERATPSPGGFGSASRRRTPGMRRDELAAAAGVSAEYVKRLEQGHGRPSAQVLYALARALRLSSAEYEYLCSLAGHVPSRAGRVPYEVGPSARHLLDRLGDVPICVLDAAWTLLAWNAACEALCADSMLADGRRRNLAWRAFTSEARDATELRFQHAIVADLRATALRYPHDDWLTDLVVDLRAVSEPFAAMWESRVDYEDRPHRLTTRHPVVGELTVDCDIMTIHEGDLRAVVYTAEPGSIDAVRLATALAQHNRLG